MNVHGAIPQLKSLFRKWWASLLLLPLAWYSLDQAYLTLHHNIFFSISYNFPFPVNIVHLLLDNFILIVHEAGHTFFSLLGWRTLTILGGSLLQIILPVLILGYFWVNQIQTGIQMSLYLLGWSFMDIAFYIADAGERRLPLIGNLSKEAHDWHNLLRQWDALAFDYILVLIVAGIGALNYLAAIVLPAFFKTYRTKNLDLDL